MSVPSNGIREYNIGDLGVHAYDRYPVGNSRHDEAALEDFRNGTVHVLSSLFVTGRHV